MKLIERSLAVPWKSGLLHVTIVHSTSAGKEKDETQLEEVTSPCSTYREKKKDKNEEGEISGGEARGSCWMTVEDDGR